MTSKVNLDTPTLKSFMLNRMRLSYEQGGGFEISVLHEDYPKLEVIYNPNENLPYKMEYYESAYDDNLVLKANSKISIDHYTEVHLDRCTEVHSE